MKYCIIQHSQDTRLVYSNIVEYCIIGFSYNGVKTYEIGKMALYFAQDQNCIEDFKKIHGIEHVYINL